MKAEISLAHMFNCLVETYGTFSKIGTENIMVTKPIIMTSYELVLSAETGVPK